MIGSTLDGKYRITRLLGSGAMGAVYEAEHAATGRRVALKVISTGDAKRDEKLVTRFQREARAAGGIDTQHIAQVLDAGVDRDHHVPFLVMELLSGEDFQQTLKRLGPVHHDFALRVIAQACLGLQKAHEAGVVHRDMKPANLFLARRDAGEVIVKLLDFGIAKMKLDQTGEMGESGGLTKTGAIVGSPLYMSPEQARGNAKEIDHRTDIWSLGAVLYQALTGRTPYQHIEALGELIIEICSRPPPPIQDFAPWVPPEVARIAQVCLRQGREHRFQSAADMLTAVRELLPHGWTITEQMMVPLSMAMKSQPAQRLVMSMPPPPPMSVVPPAPRHESVPPPAPMSVPPAQAQTALTDPSATNVGLSQSQASARNGAAPSGSRAPLVVAAAVVLTIGAGVYFLKFAKSPADARPDPAQVPVAAATVAEAPSAAPTVAPSVTVTPGDSAATRRVKVVVLPGDAVVEIEGTKTAVKDGLIEITGTLGSTHRVHLQKGKSEVTTDVTISDSGPVPPKVEIPPPGSKPVASATPSAAPATTPTVAPGIQTKFQ